MCVQFYGALFQPETVSVLHLHMRRPPRAPSLAALAETLQADSLTLPQREGASRRAGCGAVAGSGT